MLAGRLLHRRATKYLLQIFLLLLLITSSWASRPRPSTSFSASSNTNLGSLRYAPKSKQASPGLYFDPESGTFRERPPEPQVMGAIKEGNFLNGDVVAAESEVENSEEEKTYYPLLSARGAGLALAGQYDTSVTAMNRARNGGNAISSADKTAFDEIESNNVDVGYRARKKNLVQTRRSRGRSIDGGERFKDVDEEDDSEEEGVQVGAESIKSTRYRHYDDPSHVILRSGSNKYLNDYNYHGEPSKNGYDYIATALKDKDEDEENLIDVITPFSTSTFRPVTYDYAIGNGENSRGVSTAKPERRPPPYEAAERPLFVPTVRSSFRRDYPTTTTTTTTTTRRTTTTTTSSPVYPTAAVTWAPSGPRLHKGTTKYPRYTLRRGGKKKKPTPRRTKFRPKTDKEKIRKRFLDHAASLNADGRNEVAERYPSKEDEKFPHFPAQTYKKRPLIERPEGPTGVDSKAKERAREDENDAADNDLFQELNLAVKKRLPPAPTSPAPTRPSSFDLRRKTPRFDSEPELDSFSTHSSSQNTFLPFENIRLQQKKKRTSLPETRHRQRVRATTTVATTTTTSTTTPVPDPNWGEKTNFDEDEDEDERRNIVINTRHRRPTPLPSFTATTTFVPLFPRRTTTPTYISTTRRPTVTTPPQRDITRRPRTSVPISNNNNNNNYETDYNDNSDYSPFSTIPLEATPKTFFGDTRESPVKSKKPAFEFPPLFKPQPKPNAYGGYGAPDLYGQTVPRSKRKNQEKAKKESDNQPTNKGFSYSDYFGYGGPTYPTATVKSERIGRPTPAPSPTYGPSLPADPTISPYQFSSKKMSPYAKTPVPSVTVRSHSEAKGPNLGLANQARKEVSQLLSRQSGFKKHTGYGLQQDYYQNEHYDPYEMYASPTERSYVRVTEPPETSPPVSYHKQQIFGGKKTKQEEEDSYQHPHEIEIRRKPKGQGQKKRPKKQHQHYLYDNEADRQHQYQQQEKQLLRQEYQKLLEEKKKALEMLRQSQLELEEVPRRQQQHHPLREQHYHDYYDGQVLPAPKQQHNNNQDQREHDSEEQRRLRDKYRRYFRKKQEEDILRHYESSSQSNRTPKSNNLYSNSRSAPSSSEEFFDRPVPRFPSFADFSRGVAPRSFPRMDKYFPNFE